ncbi:16S RNA G1207 methylase RsmC [Paraoerskovia sediminicola]|uniref:16S RNA G1207 methylase RsmC n=1 Tax=Paraoerskovia sediminicola TaxID=1138587 RepID=A0ABM8G3P2_9CELL|nr:methyltransferase [Paraoerskovia sediminicola]BDZ42772.1 16S RNA G1207 methylase RsmC [Paraoerskovia sediminicola]
MSTTTQDDPAAPSALDALLAGLRRWPDDDDPTRVAVDATDRLLLTEAADDLAVAASDEVVVVDDRFGALTLGAVVAHGLTGLRSHQDVVTGEIGLARNAAAARLSETYRTVPLGPEAFAGARVVLMQLPRSLAALTQVSEAIAADAHPEVRVYAGGRIKHMTRAMNDVLAASFVDVHASLARQKSRVLVAARIREDRDRTPSFPVRERLEVPAGRGRTTELEVVAHGAAFGGPTLDHGTRLLLEHLDRVGVREAGGPAGTDPIAAVDLGCGTGVIATAFALAHPVAQVVATDESDAAVLSAAATARANGVRARVRVLRDDAASRLPDASADVVLLNPPFHVGAAVDTGAAHRMFAAAGRILRPGGELWCVWNSHLRYRPALSRAVGPTSEVARDARFTLTVSRR